SGSAAPSLISATAFLDWLSEVAVSSSATREVPPQAAVNAATTRTTQRSQDADIPTPVKSPPSDYSGCPRPCNAARAAIQSYGGALRCSRHARRPPPSRLIFC